MPQTVVPFPSLPCDSQTVSRLMQLPAELRLKVLRLLLKKDTPIRSKADIKDTARSANTTEDYAVYTSLSSQVLRTCQILYNEGKDVLCGENTMSLYWKGVRIYKWPPSIECHMADATVHYPPDSEKLAGNMEHLERYTHFCLKPRRGFLAYEHSLNDGGGRNAVIKMQTMLPTVKKFATFELVVQCPFMQDGSRELSIACRAVRALVEGNNVTLVLRDSQSQPLREYSEELQACLILRCASFEIANMSGERVEKIKKRVCGGDPVDDVYRLWQLFLRDVVNHLPRMEALSDITFAECYKTELEQLKEYAYGYRGIEFRYLRKKLLKRASEWLIARVRRSDKIHNSGNYLGELDDVSSVYQADC